MWLPSCSLRVDNVAATSYIYIYFFYLCVPLIVKRANYWTSDNWNEKEKKYLWRRVRILCVRNLNDEIIPKRILTMMLGPETRCALCALRGTILRLNMHQTFNWIVWQRAYSILYEIHLARRFEIDCCVCLCVCYMALNPFDTITFFVQMSLFFTHSLDRCCFSINWLLFFFLFENTHVCYIINYFEAEYKKKHDLFFLNTKSVMCWIEIDFVIWLSFEIVKPSINITYDCSLFKHFCNYRQLIFDILELFMTM